MLRKSRTNQIVTELGALNALGSDRFNFSISDIRAVQISFIFFQQDSILIRHLTYFIIFLFDQFDPHSYLKAFRKLIKIKPDAVVMVPMFVKESNIIIEELNDKKIPYLFLNANLKGYENLSYIGQKSFEAGVLSGKLSHLLCSEEKDEFLREIFTRSVEAKDDFFGESFLEA